MTTILQQLHSVFALDGMDSGASTDDLQVLDGWLSREGAPPLPPDLRSLLSIATNVVFRAGDFYICLWHPREIVELTVAYNMRPEIPGFGIGDNGWKPFLFMEGPSGLGLYRSSWGDLDPADAVFVAPSITQLLVHGVGAELID